MAAEFIELDSESFAGSIKEVQENPEYSQQFQKDVEQVRMRNDAVSAKKITRDELKQITLEKIKMEFESEKRLAPYTPKSQQEQM